MLDKQEITRSTKDTSSSSYSKSSLFFFCPCCTAANTTPRTRSGMVLSVLSSVFWTKRWLSLRRTMTRVHIMMTHQIKKNSSRLLVSLLVCWVRKWKRRILTRPSWTLTCSLPARTTINNKKSEDEDALPRTNPAPTTSKNGYKSSNVDVFLADSCPV
jgi:hypothetical protein